MALGNYYMRSAASTLVRPASSVATGGTHGATDTEGVLDSYEIPAGTLKTGSVIRLIAGGTVTDGDEVSNLCTYRVRIGPTSLAGTVIFSGDPLNPGPDDSWLIQCQAIVGADGLLYGGGMNAQGDDSTALDGPADAMSIYRMTPTAIDNSVAVLLEVTAEWSLTDDTTSIDFMIVDITPSSFDRI